MTMKRVCAICSVFIISMMICSISFAQTDIPVNPAHFKYQKELSKAVLGYVDAQFGWLETQLTAIQAGLSELEQQQLDKAIKLVKERRARLESIDVYFLKPSSTKTFDEIVTDYEDLGLSLENLVDKAEQAAAQKRGETLDEAISAVPIVVLSEDARKELQQMLKDGELRAYAGAKNLSRISILSAYIEPSGEVGNPAGLAEPDVIKQITIVIATDKSPTP